jgi:hypothetical protein
MPKLHRRTNKSGKYRRVNSRQTSRRVRRRTNRNSTSRRHRMRGGVPVENECANVDIGLAFIRNYGMDGGHIEGLIRPANLYYTDVRIRYAGNLINRCAALAAGKRLLQQAVERFGKQAVVDAIGEMEGIEERLIGDLNAME